MGRERKTLLTLAVLMLAGSAVLQPYAAWLNREKFPHEDGRKPIPGLQAVPEGTLADLAGFVTHLPIVVLEFDQGDNPGKHAVWNSRKQYAEPAETDPFANGLFSLIDNGSRNTLADVPAVETRMRSRYRGLTSLNFPKKQYLIRTLDDDGKARPVDLLGMGAADSWILNISHIDKSLLRNYLCLNIASRVMGYAPETRFCEAFRKRGDRYEYLGVYLLMEPVAYGPNRVDITKYDPRHAECAFILRRDRFQEDTVILDTYATVRRWSAGFLEVKYPGKRRLRPRSVMYIEETVSRLERALYSDDKERFLRYRDQVDITSFADYFIINELFGNYDSQWNSFFMHKDLLQPLRLGPVWDFDQAIGNNAPFVFNTQATAMQNAVWIDKMFQDSFFANRLSSRYHELRRGVLSERNLERFIDDAVRYLGDARIRDWSRWRYDNPRVLQYDPGDVIHANLLIIRTYEEEIEAMKQTLREHGRYLDENIDKLFWDLIKY